VNIELYQRVSLTRDFHEQDLRKGDIVTLVDYVNHPEGGERGCVIEIFNAVGESIGTMTVPESGIEALTPDEILTIRHFSRAI